MEIRRDEQCGTFLGAFRERRSECGLSVFHESIPNTGGPRTQLRIFPALIGLNYKHYFPPQ